MCRTHQHYRRQWLPDIELSNSRRWAWFNISQNYCWWGRCAVVQINPAETQIWSKAEISDGYFSFICGSFFVRCFCELFLLYELSVFIEMLRRNVFMFYVLFNIVLLSSYSVSWLPSWNKYLLTINPWINHSVCIPPTNRESRRVTVLICSSRTRANCSADLKCCNVQIFKRGLSESLPSWGRARFSTQA